eukprot:152761_1
MASDPEWPAGPPDVFAARITAPQIIKCRIEELGLCIIYRDTKGKPHHRLWVKKGTEIIVKISAAIVQSYESEGGKDWKDKSGEKATSGTINRNLRTYYADDDGKGYRIFIRRLSLPKPPATEGEWKTIKTQPKSEAAAGAHSGYSNNLDYRSLFDHDEPINSMHYENEFSLSHVHSNGQGGEYHNGLLVGGVIGGGSIVVLLVIFCIGLAFGMIICFGYHQKKALEERIQRKKD